MTARRIDWRAFAPRRPRRPSLWRILWACTGMLLLAACTAAVSILRGPQ
ncbi:hypothetical protein [Sphingomonas sp. Leaf4]|nr:hypothetical protein [Sphingomonas sp. Leaf4]